jgi:hypothetical protein
MSTNIKTSAAGHGSTSLALCWSTFRRKERKPPAKQIAALWRCRLGEGERPEDDVAGTKIAPPGCEIQPAPKRPSSVQAAMPT